MAGAPLRNRRYVAILALTAGLVLVAGWLLRPRDSANAPPPVPSDRDLEQLARRAQRRALEDMTRYFASLADEIGGSLPYIAAGDATAIPWDGRHIVTGPQRQWAAGQLVTFRLAGIETTGRAGLAGPYLPVTTVIVDDGRPPLPIVPRATSVPEIGAWVLAVWRAVERPVFVAGNFHQAVSGTCRMTPVREIQSSLSLTSAMIGGGLFNMDGSLLGIILPCGDRIAAVDPANVDDTLGRADTVEQRLLSRYGVRFGPVAEHERPYFTADGIVVRELWIDGPGDVARLWPGDLVVTLEGRPVTGMDDLQPLLPPSADPVELRVRRGRRTIRLTLGAGGADPAPGDSGLLVDAPADGYRIEAVSIDGSAARAGIRAGDRLTRVNGVVPRTAQQVRRALSRSAGPQLLEIVRDQRRLAVVLP